MVGVSGGERTALRAGDVVIERAPETYPGNNLPLALAADFLPAGALSAMRALSDC